MTAIKPVTPESERSAYRRQRQHGAARYRRRDALLFCLFVLPNVVIITVFNYWPNIQSFYLSLTSWDFIAPKPIFIGLKNYADLFSDTEFWGVMAHSLVYAACSVIFPIILGLGIAIVISSKIRGTSVARTLVFLPHIVTGSAIAMLWLFMFNPQFGLIRAVLGPLGIASPDWTHDPNWSLWSIIIVHIWSKLGFVAIIYSAALMGLPQDVYEAAQLDGASAWSRFVRITLPLLSPITLFLVIIETLGSFQAYELTKIITGGGPGTSSTTLTWYIYELAFSSFDVGHASAAGVVLFFVLLAITILQFTMSRKRVHYQ